MKIHEYKSIINWKGNRGEGTVSYRNYDRNYEVIIDGKSEIIQGSSDPAFLGDASKYNPEDLFLSSIASCHMLWYLHLCAVNGIILMTYSDSSIGIMEEDQHGKGMFTDVILHPEITITDKQSISKAIELHSEANKMCFIANSLNFRVKHKPKVKVT